MGGSCVDEIMLSRFLLIRTDVSGGHLSLRRSYDLRPVLPQAAEMVQKLLTPTDEVFNEHKRKQLMELASINGGFGRSAPRGLPSACDACDYIGEGSRC